jgi:hypothetical protein
MNTEVTSAIAKGEIRGKGPSTDRWGTIMRYTADNHTILDREMQRGLAGWYRAAHDKSGAFYGWTFVILKEAV